MYTLDKECPICGTYFTGRSDKQFCSGRCRVAAHRQGNLSNEEPDELEEEYEQTGAYEQSAAEFDWDADLPRRQPVAQVKGARDAANPASVDEKIDVDAIITDCIKRHNQKEDAARVVRQQQADAALAEKIHAVYVKVIEPFLELETQRLASKTLQQLADSLVDAREEYKEHPYLKQPDHVARLRLNDLRDALQVVQQARQQTTVSLRGRTGCYELKSKWRKQLQKRLLE